MACLLFDFGVVNTTDDDCEEHVPSVAVGLQQLTMVCSVYNSCGLSD